ncbi:hypothetical protein RUM44_009545 [Polyplax serrata]|uniref:Uncharacterized protein n=1 Tax=Polyplax serrata TaxID=468196 RepID=A0ABR1AUF6_POLSC
MTKTRAAMFLVIVVSTFGLIFSITDALPTTEPSPALEDVKSRDEIEENSHLGNNSRLVITNVVKTIEFEVGVLDDDGHVDDENSTAVNGTDFYETDIKLLNLDLLKEVVNKADEKLNGTTEASVKTSEASTEGTL